ncbi:MAG TPA: DUF2203 domain-containing protein, partial [Methylomirabilota bacterium]|nr:DUF2203 domain-containing protein [Methylomirabilota bacterium]
MADRYFEPAEVERLIPELMRVMARVMGAHAEAAQTRERLRAEQERISMAGGGVIDQAAWRQDSERLQRSTRSVEDGIDEILRLGGVPKDLGLGLVDFPHLRDGRVVNLCWKYGETAVRWWHGLDEGYANRTP